MRACPALVMLPRDVGPQCQVEKGARWMQAVNTRAGEAQECTGAVNNAALQLAGFDMVNAAERIRGGSTEQRGK